MLRQFWIAREVTDTKSEIQARYIDVQVKNKNVKDKTIGGHSWRKEGEIFPRSLEDRYQEMDHTFTLYFMDIGSKEKLG